jgi:hypothetical protein
MAPLTPRERRLAEALLRAKVAARDAQPGDDGGSANLDCVVLAPQPGLTERIVAAAAEAAGVSYHRRRSGVWKGWFLNFGQGQGAMNTRMVEAACEALNRAGETATVYYRID